MGSFLLLNENRYNINYMKDIGPILFFIFSCSFLSCEKLPDGSINPLPVPIDIDSTTYEVFLRFQDDQIIEMKKFHDDRLIEKTTIKYQDSIIQKACYYNDTLIQKSIYHLNDQYHAEYSYDSLYNLNRYFKTIYTYDTQGYLVEEKQIPGFNNADGEVEYIIISYSIYNGNRYGDYVLIRPPNITSTGCFTYKFTELAQFYDITTLNNSFLGIPNHNLPDSYGYQYLYRGGTYHKQISYEYEMLGEIVNKRIDTYYELSKDDSIVNKDILYFHYE